MSNDKQPRVAAVTGGAGALGGAVARKLASEGYRVAILEVEPARERALELAAELGKGVATVHCGDFGSKEAWATALEATKAALGAYPSHAALVAGGWAGGAKLHETKDDSAYERMIKSNVDTTYHALEALLPHMVAARRGSIVVIGSRAVERPWTSGGAAAYAASKAAAVTMAMTAAAEVLDHGVRINAILPSTMDTRANRAAMPNVDPSTWVSLDSAAGVIAFLLSEAARDVSGAVLPVYGRA